MAPAPHGAHVRTRHRAAQARAMLAATVALTVLAVTLTVAQASPAAETTAASCSRLRPVILALHGAGGRGGQSDSYRSLKAAFEPRGWVVLTPTAREDSGPPGWSRVWRIYPSSPDITNLQALVRSVPCRDTRRTYVLGHSMGAHMASVLGCTTKMFAAVVAVAGVTETPGCRPGSTRLLAFHGAHDPLVGLHGTVHPWVAPLLPTWSRRDRPTVVADWARLSGCRERPTMTTSSKQRTTTIKYGCWHQIIIANSGADSGHGWPSFATRAIVNFLTAAH